MGPLVTNFSEILIEIQTFSLKKIRLKRSSAKCCPFCLCLNVLNRLIGPYQHSWRVTKEWSWLFIIPHTQRSCWGVYPTSHVCSVAPTVLVGSISYLYILSSNFRRCVACKVSCKIWIFGNFLNFDFVLFWLGIWSESLVWVIMGQWGVSQNEGILVEPFIHSRIHLSVTLLFSIHFPLKKKMIGLTANLVDTFIMGCPRSD